MVLITLAYGFRNQLTAGGACGVWKVHIYIHSFPGLAELKLTALFLSRNAQSCQLFFPHMLHAQNQQSQNRAVRGQFLQFVARNTRKFWKPGQIEFVQGASAHSAIFSYL